MERNLWEGIGDNMKTTWRKITIVSKGSCPTSKVRGFKSPLSPPFRKIISLLSFMLLIASFGVMLFCHGIVFFVISTISLTIGILIMVHYL
jgi:hypothetical protein